jgi:hypothetical protein
MRRERRREENNRKAVGCDPNAVRDTIKRRIGMRREREGGGRIRVRYQESL